jgi:hypothetical protein
MALPPSPRTLNATQFFWEMLSGVNRMLLAASITDIDRDIRKQHLRREHPEWIEIEVMNQIIRESFRDEPLPQWLERQMAERVKRERAK